MTELTAKAERTRQHILDTALDLFKREGYEAATMREIAGAADVSLGLAYRYFESKEALVLALYERMADETDEMIDRLADEPFAERFVKVMTGRLRQIAPYRDAFGALFGAMMSPNSSVDLLGEGARQMRLRSEGSFIRLVETASDSPTVQQSADLGKLLYMIHFAVILFWLHDRSGGQEATKRLLIFSADNLRLLRRMMLLPMVSKEISRLVNILDSVFGGTR
jgi:AcrR family transcriptional regulator